jgi:hypothetical protein
MNSAFNKVELKSLVIDAYISNMSNTMRTIAESEFVLGYKKVRSDKSTTKKFATLMILRGVPALVLHIGERHEGIGLSIQKEVDQIIGRTYERNENQKTEKANEIFIRLDWLNDFEQIKHLIDLTIEIRD